MSEEVLIPKMTRRSASKKHIRIPMLNFVVIIFAVLLITAASFINFNIKHYVIPIDLFFNKNLISDDFIFSFFIIPQIPVVLLVCSVLGRKMALTSVILYILCGLFLFPVFALGGGIRYIFEYGFGYILAYIPAVALAGKLLNKYSFLDMIKAVLCGVLVIHFIGIVYMIILALFKHAGSDFIAGWITYQSGLKIIYDLVISFLFILIGKYLHHGLKFILE